MTVVVLFNDLFVEAVVNTALDDVRIVRRIDPSTRAGETGGMLTEELDLLLGNVPSLVDNLRPFHRTARELFGLVLDLGMKTSQDREYRAS